MSGQKDVAVRPTSVAGTFYPAQPSQCRELARGYLTPRTHGVPDPRGGLVPHAGWICCGAIAGETIATLRQAKPEADLIVIFAAVHTPIALDHAALDSFARWQSPLTQTDVSDEARRKIAESREWFVTDDRFHVADHAVEVELPLIAEAFSGVEILPIEVPPIDHAAEIGRITAKRLSELNREAIFLASSDLTHYGPNYRFTPAGVGEEALNWAKRNDARLIDRIIELDVEGIVEEVRSHQNACGAGAIAAMLAACRELGASQAQLLTHTSSYEVLRRQMRETADNAVGYASVIVG